MQGGAIRIGTRGSPLALVQAHEVRTRLMAAHGLPETAFEVVIIRTSGDRIQDRPLSEVGGKGLFTKEIEDALLAGTIDLAVHSMKDMPTVLPDGLAISSYLPRADVRDAFISLTWPSLEALPRGARVGTSSLRRAAQLRATRPDLAIVPFRGNVDTRLGKLEDGVADATLLAAAGLIRLGRPERITAMIEPSVVLPAVAQGAIGVESRIGDARIDGLVAAIDDAPTRTCLAAERALLAALDGSCRTPIAGLAHLDGGGLVTLRGQILTPDGAHSFAAEETMAQADAARLGMDIAARLRQAAGPAYERMFQG